MSREPLAALVARWRTEHEAALAVCHDVGRAKYHREALRLLAAVEAGTKCADALERVRSLMASMRTLGYFTNDEWRERLLAAGIALEDWKRVAEPVAPASHGSPEQGR